MIESVALGPGQALHLVRLAGRGLLVAATRERCELLCELEAPPPELPAPGSWRELLAARGGRK